MTETPLLAATNFYLVGIKGVAMTALASALVDAGKKVRGSDVTEDFVTKDNLKRLGVTIDLGFTADLPADTEVVIYSGANGGAQNPQVKQAQQRGLLTLSHARAQAALFNQKEGVAVCGVGGKSSVSAMLAYAWQQYQPQSYLVGVGEIIGLAKTGQFLPTSDYFFAEADEYVEDPTCAKLGEPIVPRFSFLQPMMIICNAVRFDHPDVYQNLDHTKQVFLDFFRQLKPHGFLIYNGHEKNLAELAGRLAAERDDVSVINYQNDTTSLKLAIPGKFNLDNARAALVASNQFGYPSDQFAATIAHYQSVKRRLESYGTINGVTCWDDYAHHPDELKAAIAALRAHHPQQKLVIAFQSHTYSRTKQLFAAFAAAFAQADEVVMTDIFPSAREQFDPSVTADLLCQAITAQSPHLKATNVKTNQGLADYFRRELKAGDVFATIGAGDIYQVYQLLN